MSAVLKPALHSREGGNPVRYMPLGELGRWTGGGTPSKQNPAFWTDGTIPWVSPKDMKVERIAETEDYITGDAVENSATQLVAKGSVLIVVRSGILKHSLPVAIADREVALNQDMKAVELRSDFLPEYVAWAIRASANKILHTCTKSGTTVQNLEMPKFLRYEIPVVDLAEQRRIVAELETQLTRLDASVTALKRAQANLKRYRASVLKAACEGRLVPTEAEIARREDRSFESASLLHDRIVLERKERWEHLELMRMTNSSGRPKNAKWKAKYKSPAALTLQSMHPVEGWCWASLETIAEVIDPNPSHRMPEYVTDGLPFISSENFVGSEEIDFTIGKKISDATFQRQRNSFAIEDGDFVLSRIGTIGKTRFLPVDREYGLSHALVVLKVHSASINKRWLRKTVASANVLSQAFRGVQSVGVPDLGVAKIRSFLIPLPPTAEQGRIVAEVERRLSVIEELEATVAANLKRAERLRQSVLARAFSA